jgi:hypothetical protein
MRQSWRIYLVVIGVALGWLSLAFVVVPRLGDPVSFNQVSNTASPAVAEASQTSNQAASRSFRGNVYHILLDSYQSEAYPYFLAQTPELNQPPFTYYPEFRSAAARTYFSMAELFASDFYPPGLLPESWHNAALQSGGLMGYLANSGVRLSVYARDPEQCYEGTSAVCKLTLDIKRALLGDSRARQTAADLWFLKLIPTSLKRELNARFASQDEGASDSDSFSDWDYGFSISEALSPSNMPRDRDEPYFSVQQFMQILADEDSRPATGQYVFAHVILPHTPYVLDRECNYVGRAAAQTQTDQERYLQQVQCAHKLLALLVKKLESLGRLDDSLLIVQADHGHYWQPADLGVLYQYHPMDVSVQKVVDDKADSSTWPSEMIETRASALLLIKFPGQSAASRSNKPVQMIDIAPTILRYFNIDPGSMRGMPIQTMPDSLARERLFFASNFIPDARNPKVFSKYRYVDGRWKFEENIATPTDTDLSFTLGSNN